MKRFTFWALTLAAAGGLSWALYNHYGKRLLPDLVELIRLRAGLEGVEVRPEELEQSLRHLPAGNQRILREWMQAEAGGDQQQISRLEPLMKITVVPVMATNDQLRRIAPLIFSSSNPPNHA